MMKCLLFFSFSCKIYFSVYIILISCLSKNVFSNIISTKVESVIEPCGFLSWENGTDFHLNASILENETQNENFRRLRLSLGRATKFEIFPTNSSVLNVCGYQTDYNGGYIKDVCKCIAYNNTVVYENDYTLLFYTMTSISCARRKFPDEVCKSTTCSDIAVENACAILYQENYCQSCHYNEIYLQPDEVYDTLFSSHIKSVAVRRNCQVKRTLNGSVSPSAKVKFFNGTGVHDTLPPVIYENLEVGPTFTCICSNDYDYTSTVDSSSEATTERANKEPNILAIVNISIGAIAIFAFFFAAIEITRKLVLSQNKKFCTKGIKFLGHCDPIKNVVTSIDIAHDEDIALHNLIIKETIGYGHFGIVSKGLLKLSNGNWATVAVKTLKPFCDDDTAKSSLLNEIKVMRYIGCHPNIIQLIGSCIQNTENIFMIIELCSKGTIEGFLKDKKRLVPLFRNSVDDIEKSVHSSSYTRLVTVAYNKTGKEKENSNMFTQMLNWSRDIADGMNFLSSKNVVHIDLAIRNILLTDDLTAKIADFGLSRKIYSSPNYTKSLNDDPLPFRTMSPESLENNVFGEKSDVWSFGVTLWEIFSFGEMPFRDINCEWQLLKLLKEGRRLQQPSFLKDVQDLYTDVMLSCWNIDPTRRPTFEELRVFLVKYLNQH